MQKKSGVREGSDCVGAGRDGVDKWRGSWREARDVRAAEPATPKHWASIEMRRKRQIAHRDKVKGRSSKRTRRAFEARVADRNVGARVDAREQPDYGLRGRDDTDECSTEHEYDTIWGDTVVASRREPCASPPVKKLDFEPKVAAAADGRITLVAPEANVDSFEDIAERKSRREANSLVGGCTSAVPQRGLFRLVEMEKPGLSSVSPAEWVLI